MSEAWKKEVTERNIMAGLTTRFGSYSVDVCLFCREPEENYNPDKGIEFVCGNCVILLSSASQEELKSAHKKATEVKSFDQVRAFESFIIPEETDGKRPEKRKTKNKTVTRSIGKRINRKRTP